MGAADRKKIGKITVKVVNAKNLKNQELLSKSDPYCKVILSHTTTTIIYYHTATYYIHSTTRPLLILEKKSYFCVA